MRRMYEAIESCYPTLWYASMRERLHAIRRHMESVPGLKAPERLYQRIHDAVAPTTSLDENHVIVGEAHPCRPERVGKRRP